MSLSFGHVDIALFCIPTPLDQLKCIAIKAKKNCQLFGPNVIERTL
jgi:hypothetical protein